MLTACVLMLSTGTMTEHGHRIKGRAAVNNPANRFHDYRHEAFDDGWGIPDADLDAP